MLDTISLKAWKKQIIRREHKDKTPHSFLIWEELLNELEWFEKNQKRMRRRKPNPKLRNHGPDFLWYHYEKRYRNKAAEKIGKVKEWDRNHPRNRFQDTSIELKIEAELKRRDIDYRKQVRLCKVARVDFYLPGDRIIVQCDGDYWHNLPGAQERDERQDKVLIFNGFNVYRFWEHEINKSAEECIDRILTM